MTKRTPAIYARRPPCKWHGYDCHRPVIAGRTLCAYHEPVARERKKADRNPAYDLPVGAWESADPGCDCPACLLRLAYA